MVTEETRQLRVDVPVAVYEWFKIAAVKRRMTLRELVTQALQAYIAQEEAKARGSAGQR